ncbi:signal peptide peptidase SppA [Salidesulfovibrio onnuriiensis]|uniref:signal peptide peptidase SppA n=1 Tax=Salidesulfovibrio onnuriiensis TaxID=2583823 RepID=UPI0011CA12C3|nr:signal peptide peptidase SppA [Salidesulfovibrio onnuriiensis]
MKKIVISFLILMLAVAAGCSPKFKLFTGQATSPLKESVLEGEGDAKILLVNVNGFLDDKPKSGLLTSKPGSVQELVSNLRLAEQDEDIKGVVVKINSPGGTTTASDILYRELMRYREKTGNKVVALMMDVAASGGYYTALAADSIVAHPTTITGSVGVIFMRPKVDGLMEKIGVDVEISKSGMDKDMGSPFRATTDRERRLFQEIIDDMAGRFYALVQERRNPTRAAMDEIKTARVFTATRARELGLIDHVGYMQDAFAEARKLAGVSEARIVTYRRDQYPNDNPYNTLSSADPANPALVNMHIEHLVPRQAGFYYLWSPSY